MTAGMSQEKKVAFNKIFEELASELDITKKQYETLKRSYTDVGTWLNDDESLSPYNVDVYPQGSFRLGTIIQPINEEDDLDIDLVCRLTSKPQTWTQKDLKDSIGDRLKEHKRYVKMIKDKNGGRRCWTLLYREDNPEERYHLDVLPAVVDRTTISVIDEMARQEYNYENVKKSAIRITDKEDPYYSYETNADEWLKSFPDGYAAWFESRCKLDGGWRIVTEAVAPINAYVEKKTVLQKVIQILKRHRDVMFNGDEDKPISIIITTLAAKAYKGEANLVDALKAVVCGMSNFIQNKDGADWVENPVNPEENFADKWEEAPAKKRNFYKWLAKVQQDVGSILRQEDVTSINGLIGSLFGERLTQRVFENLGKKQKQSILDGNVRINSVGTMGAVGALASHGHTFFGS